MLKNKTNQKGGSIIYNNDLNFNQLYVTVNLRDKLGDPDNFILLNVLNKLYYTEYENGFEFHPELNYTGFIYLGAYNWVEDEYYTDIALNTYRSRDKKPAFEILRPGMTVLRTTSIDKISDDGKYEDKGYVYGEMIRTNINDRVRGKINHIYWPHNWLKRNYFSFEKYSERLKQYKKNNKAILRRLYLDGDHIDFNTLFKHANEIPSMQPHERIFVSYFGTDYFTFRKFFRERNIEPLFVGITYEKETWNIKSGIFNNYMSQVFYNNDDDKKFGITPSRLHLSEHDDVLLIYSIINMFQKLKQKKPYKFKNTFVEVIFKNFKIDDYEKIKKTPYLNHEMFMDKCSEYFNNKDPSSNEYKTYTEGIKENNENIIEILNEIKNMMSQKESEDSEEIKIKVDQTYVRNEGKSFYNNKILINLLYELTITRNYTNDNCTLNEYYEYFYNKYELRTSDGFKPIGYINDSYSDAISIFENEYCYNKRNNRNLPLTIPFFFYDTSNLPFYRITDGLFKKKEDADKNYNTFTGGYIYLRKNGYNYI